MANQKKYNNLLSNAAKNMNPSLIREMFKVLSDPKIISFAGGAPAIETFPVDAIKKLNDVVLKKYAGSIFQYGITEGFLPLRKELQKILAKRKIDVSYNNICVSTGAQSAIDAVSKVLIDKNDCIAVESPTFLAAIKAFKVYHPKILPVLMTPNGLDVTNLEEILRKKRIKFLYTIPNFQNPTGISMSIEIRRKVANLAKKYNFIIIEDDPYYDLRYAGKPLPTIYSFAPNNTVYIGSLSKVFSPGMRLGYYVARNELCELITSARQASEVHANSYAQALATEYIKLKYLQKQLPKTLKIYKSRLNTMKKALNDKLGSSFKIIWPKGGMFVWVEGPLDFDASKAYKKALRNNVAFVPGSFFHVDPCLGNSSFRLNFTNVSEDRIIEGVTCLAESFSVAIS